MLDVFVDKYHSIHETDTEPDGCTLSRFVFTIAPNQSHRLARLVLLLYILAYLRYSVEDVFYTWYVHYLHYFFLLVLLFVERHYEILQEWKTRKGNLHCSTID